MLPAELQVLIAQVDACEARAGRVVADLSDDEVNWSPGGWSIAQCLEHLTLMNAFYLQGWGEAIAEAAAARRGPFKGVRPTPFGRWFVRSLEPPARFKAKAIPAVTPRERYAPDDLVSRYRASHDLYRHLVRTSAAVDVNRIVRPNAILRRVKMRLATVLLVIPAHDRRHLWQAENVRRALKGA